MPLNDAQKTDYGWKKSNGVSPTDTKKNVHNERYHSIAPIFQRNFWTDSDLIPETAPTSTVVVGGEIWADIVEPRYGTSAVKMFLEPSSTHSYIAGEANLLNTFNPAERIVNWVPPTFDFSYNIKVWSSDPQTTTSSNARVYPDTVGFEWSFDYSTGIVYFHNEIPPLVKQNGLWIEGWVYIGELGRENDSTTGADSKIRRFTFVSSLLAPNDQADFSFETGGRCILVEAKTDTKATVECHSTTGRLDSNPYRFKAVSQHLVDDGSYTVGGQRYYGERFINLINMDDTIKGKTFWRVINDDTMAKIITVIVSVA